MSNYDLLISAIVGGLFGAFFTRFIPHVWFSPQLKILCIDPHGYQFRLLVKNKGRQGAINAIGRVTIRGIKKGDIIGTREEIYKIRKKRNPDTNWMYTDDSYLRAEEWETGIEMEHLHWATMPSGKNITINPQLVERLQFVYSDGPYFKIASENPYICRTRLRLDKNKEYYGEVIISAENAKPSNRFRFKIILGDNNRAKVLPYEGNLPTK